MVFSSTVFLMIYLPFVWGVHAIIPKRFLAARNVFLAIASLLFYAYGEPFYIVLMLGSVLINYLSALWINKLSGKGKNAVCFATVALNIGMLGVFKYSPWLISMLNSVSGLDLHVPEITIPVGISFYTFQILSYVVDVKRGKTAVQKKFFDLLLYISFFPQLIAGPIVKYGDINDQIAYREITPEKTAQGIRRFVYGLSKKVLISNTAAVIVDAAFVADGISSAFAWLGAVAYCIQIYFDFSGYSDMAIGLAKMFGFDLLENFNYPYSAVSIRDFWKRWHISLTSWFREYVYFPLGGNRAGKVRTVLNRLIVFFLTGLWHGANFTFIVWGLWHGLLMMFEQVVHFDKLTKKGYLRPITWIYTFVAVCLGFVVFRAPDISTAFAYIGSMFSFSGGFNDALLHFSPYNCLFLVFAVIFAMPVVPALKKLNTKNEKGSVIGEALSYVLCIPLLVLCIMSLASSTFNPFIYYHF